MWRGWYLFRLSLWPLIHHCCSSFPLIHFTVISYFTITGFVIGHWGCFALHKMALETLPPLVERPLRHIASRGNLDEEFSIVTYNILADCWLNKDILAGRYEYVGDEANWKKEGRHSYRHKLLMSEVCWRLCIFFQDNKEERMKWKWLHVDHQ